MPNSSILYCFKPWSTLPKYLKFIIRIFEHTGTLRKKAGHMTCIGLHQNRPAHATKMTRFRVSYQQMLVSLPICVYKLTQNLVNLFAYEDRCWMNKFTCVCGSVLMQMASFYFMSEQNGYSL